MDSAFDPYHVWLGISRNEQPPNHYRLLGISLFESDLQVIDGAADRQMRHLRTFQTGKYGSLSQRLLNEVSAARVCLLDPQRKAAYDQQLRGSQENRSAPVPAPHGEMRLQSAPAVPGSPSLPHPTHLRPRSFHASQPTPSTAGLPVVPSVPIGPSAPAVPIVPVVPSVPIGPQSREPDPHTVDLSGERPADQQLQSISAIHNKERVAGTSAIRRSAGQKSTLGKRRASPPKSQTTIYLVAGVAALAALVSVVVVVAWFIHNDAKGTLLVHGDYNERRGVTLMAFDGEAADGWSVDIHGNAAPDSASSDSPSPDPLYSWSLDGQQRFQFPPGKYVIVARRRGFRDQLQIVDIREDLDTEFLFISWQPKTTLVLNWAAEDRPKAMVKISKPDGALEDTSAARLEIDGMPAYALEPGTYRITIERPGFRPFEANVSMTFGQLTLDVTLIADAPAASTAPPPSTPAIDESDDSALLVAPLSLIPSPSVPDQSTETQ
jgi:hypothetical protein